MLKKSLIFTAILCVLAPTASAQDTAASHPPTDPEAQAALPADVAVVPAPTGNAPMPAPSAQTDTQAAPEETFISATQTASQRAARQDKQSCSESFTSAHALMRAENAYVRRKYETVIEILRPLYDTIQCFDDPDAVLEVNLLLGVAYFEQNNLTLADTFFMNVLRSDPEHIVGSTITLPESSAHRIETLREQHAEELEALRRQSAPNTVIESL